MHEEAGMRACVISRISSSSPRKSTSFWLLVTGQYLSIAFSTGSASFGSFSTNCTKASASKKAPALPYQIAEPAAF